MNALNQSSDSREIKDLFVKNEEPAALTIDERGMIFECSKACEKLFGYSQQDLVCQPVSKLLPQLFKIKFFVDGQINPRLVFFSRCGQLFQATGKKGNIFDSTLNFVNLNANGKQIIRLLVSPVLKKQEI